MISADDIPHSNKYSKPTEHFNKYFLKEGINHKKYYRYKSIDNTNAKTIYLSPQGKTLNQDKVKELSKEKHLIILCGHYEGIDQRAIDEINPEEISVGDYILTGGELPAMILIDAVSRYVDGVLNEDSVKEESFTENLLEYPQYTRPEIFLDRKVPEVLISRKS